MRHLPSDRFVQLGRAVLARLAINLFAVVSFRLCVSARFIRWVRMHRAWNVSLRSHLLLFPPLDTKRGLEMLMLQIALKTRNPVRCVLRQRSKASDLYWFLPVRMEDKNPERKTPVGFLAGINRDGIPRFDVFASTNLLAGVDGEGIRCRAQRPSLSSATFNMEGARVLKFESRIIACLLRLNWHELAPNELSAGWTLLLPRIPWGL